MLRSLHSELIDELPPDHPAAIQTRRDLRRINALMGHAGIFTRALLQAFPKQPPSRILEIGAGDGEMLLRVAQRLPQSWRDVDVVFLDRQDLLRGETKSAFATLNWNVRSVRADIFDWLNESAEKTNVILANLVLHHFSESQLSLLFSIAAQKTEAFIAVEPRRSRWPLFCARSLALIGCGPVTRHDAPVSVQAGFNRRELSALWPRSKRWELVERRAGMFSHLFVARKRT